MRLIDADALNLDYEVEMADDWKTAYEIANVVKYAMTVDAVRVVKCSECAYRGVFKICTYNGRCEPTENDDYCSKGKIRENAE